MPLTRIKKLSTSNYIIGLLAIFAGVYSQYFIHGYGFIPQLMLVYGFPIIIVSLLLGKPILRRAFKNTSEGLSYGIAYFGIFVVLSYFATLLLISLISQYDPEALNSLGKSLPFLNISSKFAWIMVATSMLIIGPAEEYLFRGFVFGGLLRIFKNTHWVFLAFVSSVLFALAHSYYFFIFGAVSAIFFVDIVAIGMALCFAYYFSKGNLLAPALIHGFFDATDFLSIATASNVGTILRLLLAILGILLAFFLAVRYFVGRFRPNTE